MFRRAFGFPELIALFVGGSILIPFLLIGGLLLLERWRLRGKGLALALVEFRVNTSDNAPEIIYLRARHAGLLGALMAAWGLDQETVLSVTHDEFTLDRVGLSGFVAECAPLSRVASAECWYYRSITFLFLALLTCLFGPLAYLYSLVSTSTDDYARQEAFRTLGPDLLIAAAVAGLFYLFYVLSKRVILSIETFGGKSVGISYKRSVIQGTSIDLPQAVEAVALLNSAIRRKADRDRSHLTATATN